MIETTTYFIRCKWFSMKSVHEITLYFVVVYTDNIAYKDANEAKMNEEIYNTARWQNTNQQQYTTGNAEGMEEGDVIIEHDETLNEIPPPNGPPPAEAYAAVHHQGTRPRVKTPDPPPPPNADRIISNASDNAVMYNDFNIAEAQPDLQKAETKGVNLYFLDPGDQQTKGIPNNNGQ